MKDFTLRISGSITIGVGDIQIHNKVREALLDDCDIIVLDLTQVTYMDSAAVGELVACFTSVKNRGAQFALVGLTPKVKRLMQTMCFLDLFQVYDTIEDALQIMRARHKKNEAES